MSNSRKGLPAKRPRNGVLPNNRRVSFQIFEKGCPGKYSKGVLSNIWGRVSWQIFGGCPAKYSEGVLPNIRERVFFQISEKVCASKYPRKFVLPNIRESVLPNIWRWSCQIFGGCPFKYPKKCVLPSIWWSVSWLLTNYRGKGCPAKDSRKVSFQIFAAVWIGHLNLRRERGPLRWR